MPFLKHFEYDTNNFRTKCTPLHSKCTEKILIPWITHAVLRTQGGPHHSFILHNPSQKSIENPYNSKLLTVFPWSVHPGFMSKLNNPLSNYPTRSWSSRSLQSTSTRTGAHQPLKHHNGSFHMNICIFWLDGPRVPRSQNKVCCPANLGSFF